MVNNRRKSVRKQRGTKTILGRSEICTAIRTKTGLTIKDWALKHGFPRAIVYQSSLGAGSRAARIQLALQLGKIPSMIWPNRREGVKRLDDLYYQDIASKVEVEP